MTTQTVVPIVRNLRGLDLLRALLDLLSEPAKMAEKTGLVGARYDQREPGHCWHSCDSAACMFGWMAFLAGEWDGRSESTYSVREIGELASLNYRDANSLFFGFWDRWGEPAPERGSLPNRTNEAAVRVLDRLIAEQEAKQAQS